MRAQADAAGGAESSAPAGGISFPIRAGAVDAGSNAIRFLAAEFSDERHYDPLVFDRVPIRLGHQVFLQGRLAPEALDAAVRAFVTFRDHLASQGIQHYRAIATSAVREARNGQTLVDRIARETGIRLEVITGTEEARLVHLAVGSRIDLTGGTWILADLGGGSVEVSLVDDAGILWSESHTMGSVRLLEELSGTESDPGAFQRLLAEYVSVLRIPAPAQYWQPSGFIATGGNIEALAQLGVAEQDESGVMKLNVADLAAVIDMLARMSYRQRMEKFGLRDDRADVILPAAMVYQRLAQLVGVSHILVPNVGVKEGIVLDLIDDLVSHDRHEARQEQQLVQAAVSLGRRYMFDEAHGLQVGRLATSLFDQLSELHQLKKRDRSVLLAAAILHDVGMYISRSGHHKHSMYIISESEFPGLSDEQILLAANVARYHRKSFPEPRHTPFMRLSPKARAKVPSLAGILRIADSLDRQQLQLVESVLGKVAGDTLHLLVEGKGDLMLERWAVAKRSGLLTEALGLKVRVEA
jgi:exopolyphosphatase/guanosine-5'-triphosphate,3'-diphosphate pyrophosphatase